MVLRTNSILMSSLARHNEYSLEMYKSICLFTLVMINHITILEKCTNKKPVYPTNYIYRVAELIKK